MRRGDPGRLSQAKSPAILAGQDVDRYGAAAEVVGLAERLQMPVAVTGPAKAVIDETFPCYAGIYNGKGSDPRTREASEARDCLLSIGYRPIDGTSGDFTASLPADTIRARGHSGGYRRAQPPGGDAQGSPARRHRRVRKAPAGRPARGSTGSDGSSCGWLGQADSGRVLGSPPGLVCGPGTCPGSLSTSRWTTTSFQNCGSPGWIQSGGFSS